MNELGIVKYDVTDIVIAEMRTQYMALTVKSLDDEAGFRQVHAARMVVKDHRVAVEKKRKDLKADALEYGRKVDSEAKRITALLEPIEFHLLGEEEKVTKEKERIKAEKIRLEQERVAGIRAKILEITGYTPGLITTAREIQGMIDALDDIDITTEVYQEFAGDAARTKANVLSELQIYLKDRLAWEKAETERKAESERLAKEKAELRDESERLDKIRKEQERETARLAAEAAALEAYKRAEEQKKRDEEFKRQALETARITAERDAIEKVAREAREKQEREAEEAEEKARQESLKPDKEKVQQWARALQECLLELAPMLSSPEAKRIMAEAEAKIDKAVSAALKQAKEL